MRSASPASAGSCGMTRCRPPPPLRARGPSASAAPSPWASEAGWMPAHLIPRPTVRGSTGTGRGSAGGEASEGPRNAPGPFAFRAAARSVAAGPAGAGGGRASPVVGRAGAASPWRRVGRGRGTFAAGEASHVVTSPGVAACVGFYLERRAWKRARRRGCASRGPRRPRWCAPAAAGATGRDAKWSASPPAADAQGPICETDGTGSWMLLRGGGGDPRRPSRRAVAIPLRRRPPGPPPFREAEARAGR
jgi:hypothetical protein